MKKAAARLVGVVLALGFTVGLGWLSRLSWEAEAHAGGVIRLAWKTRSARVEECRVPREDELAGIPVHMRPTEICEREVQPYRLHKHQNILANSLPL